MSEQDERHGDAAAVFDCLKYFASAGGEYEYRGTLAIAAFDRICTSLVDVAAENSRLRDRIRELEAELAHGVLDATNRMVDARADALAQRDELLAVAEELEASAAYWSEYDVPLGIVDRLRAAIAKAKT